MRSTVVLLTGLLLSGCASWKYVSITPELTDGAKTAVLSTLRDPASAQFGDRFAAAERNGVDAICGTVNAKNGFGGYVGTTVFAVFHNHSNGQFIRMGNDDQSILCSMAGATTFSTTPPKAVLSAQGVSVPDPYVVPSDYNLKKKGK